MTGKYELDVTAWKADHPDWILAPGPGSILWRTRPKHGPGGWVHARSLDELAKAIDERQDDGRDGR